MSEQLTVAASGEACGAAVTGVDLSRPLEPATVAAIRAAWLEHHVLSFPDQHLSTEDLEHFTLAFGPFGVDPFIEPLPDHPHVIALHRAGHETAPIFADAWHTDWSFLPRPPDGTCLHGIVIPPQGGDTLFADQVAALAAMPAELRSRIEGRNAIHSAAVAYAPDGIYGTQEDDVERATKIIYDESANEHQLHPLIRVHPETGVEALFGCIGYVAAIEGLDKEASDELLRDLYFWQTREEFQYRHRWQTDMVVMWDNRAVLHRATAGYDGYERLLHRTTIGAGAR